MGSKTVINETLCYLIEGRGDEILILPRNNFEPDLRDTIPALSRKNHGYADNRGLEYLSLSPWSGYSMRGYEKYSDLDNAAQTILASRAANISKYRKNKLDFEHSEVLWNDQQSIIRSEHFNPLLNGARQLLNLLEAFSWVSQKFSVECLGVGDGRDFDFKIFEKNALSFIGKAGKVVHQFRWSEFLFLEVTDIARFAVTTIDGTWGAGMGRGGFAKR